jgi:hypothetical protein
MKSANAIKTYRKFGVAEGRDLRCAMRVPHLYRSTTTFSFVTPEPSRPVPVCRRTVCIFPSG